MCFWNYPQVHDQQQESELKILWNLVGFGELNVGALYTQEYHSKCEFYDYHPSIASNFHTEMVAAL